MQIAIWIGVVNQDFCNERGSHAEQDAKTDREQRKEAFVPVGEEECEVAA